MADNDKIVTRYMDDISAIAVKRYSIPEAEKAHPRL